MSELPDVLAPCPVPQKIGAVARRSGMPVKTIRFYCDQGLLQPSARSEGRYRLFDETVYGELALIRMLRALEIPLATIGEVLEARRFGICHCDELKATITAHPQFAGFLSGMARHFAAWRQQAEAQLLALEAGCHPKAVIRELSEGLLAHYEGQPLIDAYAVYQLLLDQWAETMQDDVYAISAEGWQAETYRVLETDKKGKTKDKGWACDLVPKELLVRQLFAGDLEMIEALRAQLEEASSRLAELEEEHSGEEGAFSELDKINKAAVNARIKEIRKDPEAAEELAVLQEWLELSEEEAATKKALKAAEAELDDQAYGRYDSLTEAEVRELVVQGKWLASLEQAVATEVERVSQALTGRLKVLGERYGAALPAISERVDDLEARVAGHLKRMGFSWN